MHQPTLVKWADLLGPLFPTDAAVDLRPQLNQISISWVARDGDGPSAARGQTVAIFIAPNALKDYRNAQDGQQARADRKLFSLVHSSLKGMHAEDDPARMPGELKIVVASVDILSR
jgi:hypothetical protein